MDYKTTKFCPIDNSKMIFSERESGNGDEKIYFCKTCGFGYWIHNVKEQIDEEAKEYFYSLSKEDKKEIKKKILDNLFSLPDDKCLEIEANNFYNQLVNQRELKKDGFEKGLRMLENWAKSF